MSLKDLIRPPVVLAPRIVILGPEGVGKTTLAAGAPSPLFVGSEDGLPLKLKHIPTIPCRTWNDFEVALGTVRDDQTSEFRTLVIDTADWMTRLLETQVCDQKKVASVEEIGGGFGKGDRLVADEWTRRVIPTLNAIREERGMTVIILAHADAITVKNPEGADYSMTDLRLPKKVAAALREWADAVLLADWEVRVSTAAREPKPGDKGKMTLGPRVLATERGNGWMAKNRYELPPELPLSWAALAKHLPQATSTRPDPLAEPKAELRALAKEVGGDTVSKVEAEITAGNRGPGWYPNAIAKLRGILADRAKGRQPGEEG